MTMADTTRHVIDFDHHGTEFRDDNKGVIKRLHESGCPLGWSEAHGGYWAVYGYDAVYAAVHDTELFSSVHSPQCPKGVPPGSYDVPLLPIDVDGDMVKEYRRVVLAKLSPSGAVEDERRVREITTDLIDAFIERGSCDLSQELLTALPARWILEKLDWTADRWPEWIEWIHATVHDRTDDPAKAEAAAGSIFTNIMTELAARRAQPGDDIFSALIAAAPGGQPMDDTSIVMMAFLLLLGGMDTTAGLTGNAIEQLDRDRALRQRLIDDPALIARSVEEFLRHDSPAFGLYRTVTRDAEFFGQPLKAGDRVMLMFPATGLDPNVFDDPETIDFERTGNRHMGFGLGPHRCLGSHHARVMYRVMMEEILRRLPDYEIDGSFTRFHDSGDVYAIRSLPVRFTPGPRSTRAA